MKTKVSLLAVIWAGGILGFQLASAGVITLTSSEDGFITDSAGCGEFVGFPCNNGTFSNNNYFLGNFGGEYRDFFGFVIPDLNGQTVASATLMVLTGREDLDQSPSLTVGFSSLATTSDFSALGTGTPYGSFTYTSPDQGQIEDIVLDAAALSDIESDAGSTFLIGGRALPPTSFGQLEQVEDVYAGTGGVGQFNPELILTTESVGVPEPATLALFGLGLLGVALARRRPVLPRDLPGV